MTKFVPTQVGTSPTGLQHLVVISVISNPVRYRSRYRLYREFAEVMKQAGATLITVEQAFGERPFEVTERDNPLHLQMRTVDELWHKENMINVGINYALQVFPDAKYFAWIDADVLPMRPARQWLEETVQQLQHYHVVQMFETAVDVGPNHTMVGESQESFMSRYIKSGCKPPKHGHDWGDYYYTQQGHPGYAWAATKEALDGLGGLIDFSILGAGDRHMALGLIGCIEQSFGTRSSAYRNRLLAWQQRSERWIKRDVGYVPGSIYHFWHGPKKSRGYVDRWKILTDNAYNPDTDIKKDAQGLYVLETWSPRQVRLRDQIRAYFRSRNEDDVRVD
jgi:hypothetical protein